MGVVLRRGKILIAQREGHRQAPRGRDPAGEQVGDRIAALLSGEPGQQNGVGKLPPRGGLHHAADVHHHDHPLARAAARLGDAFEQEALGGREVEIPLDDTVRRLARAAPQHHDGRVAGADLPVDKLRIAREVHLREHRAVVGDLLPGRAVGVSVEGLVLVGHIFLIEAPEAFVEREARVAQSVADVADVGLVHVRGARAAGDRLVGRGAEERDALRRLQRQGLPRVLEQHHALVGNLAREGGMRPEVGRGGAPALCRERAEDDAQHVAHAGVEHRLPDRAALHRLDDLADDLLIAGHDQRAAGFEQPRRGAPHGPVGEHQPVETPLVAQQVDHQLAVGLRIFARNAVVGAHDAPRLRLAHAVFEGPEVDFAQGPLRHAGVVYLFARLLVVGHEVLEARADALRLDPFDHRRGQVPREQRIFGVVFEVAAAERVAHDVDAGGEDHVDAVGAGFAAHRLPLQACRAAVPGGGQRRGRGEAGAVAGRGPLDGLSGESCHGNARLVVDHLRGGRRHGVDAHADGTVGQVDRGDAQLGQGAGPSRGPFGAVAQRVLAARGADQKAGLLFEGHAADQPVDLPVGEGLGGHKCGGCGERARQQKQIHGLDHIIVRFSLPDAVPPAGRRAETPACVRTPVRRDAAALLRLSKGSAS